MDREETPPIDFVFVIRNKLSRDDFTADSFNRGLLSEEVITIMESWLDEYRKHYRQGIQKNLFFKT